jgi:site-specific DNA-cytosine methylase
MGPVEDQEKMIGRRLGGLIAVAVGVTCWPASAVHAQPTYRCNVQGRQVLSDRPCAPGAHTNLSSYGPTQRELPTRPMQAGTVGRAPDHLQYLSTECAQLNDALRTAGARGVGHAVQRDLQMEYQRKCAEDDSEARRQVWKDKSAERQARRDEREARASEKAQTQREREQCNEMLRILHAKRQRMATLTPGEQADLQRFEDNYNARCKG